jgi:hypothetical protein
MRHTWRSVGAVLVAFAVVGSACSSAGDGAERGADEQRVTVLPNLNAGEFAAQVAFTAEGMDPEILFVPAGVPVRLALRNRTESEHHYRVEGLLATEIGYVVFPELDATDIAYMTEEELREFDPAFIGVTDEAEMEHLLHHLQPYLIPTKPESRNGIKPIPGEVHGYTQRGQNDIVQFIPLTTGRYTVSDPLNPGITGTLVVFLPPDAVAAG